jgi:hypothetical protein
MKTIDLLTLASVDDHPVMQEQHRILTDALDQQSQADAKHAKADADLAALEDAAANGHRDEKRLQRAREAVHECHAEQRIAARRVANAERAVTDACRATCEALYRQLQDEFGPAIKRFDAALAEAQRGSHDVATLEEASRRLLGANPYRNLPGRALLHGVAWWDIFGGPRSDGRQETRYSIWRKFCRRWLDG